jgi:clan AA aspartic protease
MGKTFVDVEVENSFDLQLREATGDSRRKLRREKVRAFVDTGSALLCLPKSTIRKLGLRFIRSTEVRTGNGKVDRGIYGSAQITILGRQCDAEVMEIPEDVRPLLGFIPLESLDLVVDPKSNRVTPNPEHGGEPVLDLISFWP